MSVRMDGDIIRLEGDCRVEDAEALLSALQSVSRPTVELSACKSLHTAVAQVLLALRPSFAGQPQGALARDQILPALLRAIAGPDGRTG